LGDVARPQNPGTADRRVTAPSPIRRHRRAARHATAAPATPGHRRAGSARAAPDPPAVTWGRLQARLPVVIDQFATVTVVANDELRRSNGNTLATCCSQARELRSSFAPGASSRPIIRGLDVIASASCRTASAAAAPRTWARHFRTDQPADHNQVEVIRGPATLRYGSQSIGGVVSANRNAS